MKKILLIALPFTVSVQSASHMPTTASPRTQRNYLEELVAGLRGSGGIFPYQNPHTQFNVAGKDIRNKCFMALQKKTGDPKVSDRGVADLMQQLTQKATSVNMNDFRSIAKEPYDAVHSWVVGQLQEK